jgi:DNA-binding beta-propeller fold protein YncE
VITVPEGVGGLVIAPDGKMAWALATTVEGGASYSDSYVTPINLVTGVAEPPIVLHYDPYGIAVSPDGRTIWVTGGTAGDGPNSGTPDLRSISLATGRVDGTYKIPGGANDIVNATSGG